jgi:nicotinate-nucleotide--dimethylbenzimidazole phosphoribosyltransferase
MNDNWYSQPVPPPCKASRLAALERQNTLTKPQGSLGRMETIAVELAAQQRSERPVLDRVAIIIFAADHGITAEGISAFPSEVTSQMLANYVQGGAAISVLARSLGAPLTVVDVGTYSDRDIPQVLHRKIARGTMNFAQEPAMRPEQAEDALTAGAAIVEAIELRPQLLVLGEMGIGNTTSAAAVAAALLGRAPVDLVGAGTGVDGATIDRKAVLIEAALTRAGCASRAVGATEALSLVGGFEIAALAGAMVRAAQLGISVLVDGFIASVAALCAVQLNPDVRAWLIFAHRSHERGHKIILDELGAKPLLDLGMRLGEGSGAAIAVPLLRLACDLHSGMATFDEAAVADRA